MQELVTKFDELEKKIRDEHEAKVKTVVQQQVDFFFCVHGVVALDLFDLKEELNNKYEDLKNKYEEQKKELEELKKKQPMQPQPDGAAADEQPMQQQQVGGAHVESETGQLVEKGQPVELEGAVANLQERMAIVEEQVNQPVVGMSEVVPPKRKRRRAIEDSAAAVVSEKKITHYYY